LVLTAYAPSVNGLSQTWTISFTGTEQCTGELTATESTGILTVTAAVGELAVSTTTI
jgi:hypothetical protein